MRLQITVLRNCLEPVRNVFNTESSQYKQGSIVYISDLLKAVDSFIQLESDSWGYEDYTVETKLNDSQDLAYELFHWQLIRDVLRDDDEVVIRPISEVEMRQRLKGGRHQVRKDGVHLIDGGAWGKGNLLPPDHRPKIFIPPRQHSVSNSYTQPAALENREEEEELQLQIEDAPALKRNVLIETEQDDETDEDDDFVDTSETSSDASSEVSEDEAERDELPQDEQPPKSRHTPSMASGTVDRDHGQFPRFDKSGQYNKEDEVSGQELEALKADALKAGYRPDSKKRKRSETLQVRRTRRKRNKAQLLGPSDTSQIVSTPQAEVISNKTAMNPTVTFDGNSQIRDTNDDSSSEYEKTSTSDSGSLSDDGAVGDVKTAERRKHEDDVQNDTSSSGSDSDSASDVDSDFTSSDDSVSGSSSESDSDSGTTSDSSSSSGMSDTVDNHSPNLIGKATEAPLSESLEKWKETSSVLKGGGARRKSPSEAVGDDARDNQEPKLKESTSILKVNAPPGQGQNKTKRNNERKKLNKVMKRLKEEGKLHQNANFEDLRTYLLEQDEEKEVTMQAANHMNGNHQNDENVEAMHARREEIFQKLNAQSVTDVVVENVQLGTQQDMSLAEQANTENPHSESVGDTLVSTVPSESRADETTSEVQSTPEMNVEQLSLKRTRLDVASSRRMVFSALGVRNPKTPAAEHALREKLAKPTRQQNPKISEELQQSDTVLAPLPLDRWKKKLIIKAVECVQKNKKIEVPPFPFRHPWQVRKEKERFPENHSHHNASNFHVQGAGEADDEDVEMDYGEDFTHMSAVSRRAPAELDCEQKDDMSIPSDFDVLFDLQKSDLIKGAVIAYKELHLNENFQPEESPYRVARILMKDRDKIQLRLATQSRQTSHARYDEDTGQRVYSKFEMPDDDEETPDDGLREIAFADMIRPKFVSPSNSAEAVIADDSQRSVETPLVDGGKGQIDQARHGSSEALNVSKVTETEPEVSSSRQAEINEIIKDAGFHSALDEQLVEPLAETTPSREHRINTSSQAPGTDNTESSKWWSSSDIQSSPIEASGDRNGANDSSVPSESMVESVRYPRLPNIDFDTTIASNVEQSSSHQDAQRTTSVPAANTTEVMHSVLEDNVDVGTPEQVDEDPASLPSEVPQSQLSPKKSVSKGHQNVYKSSASALLSFDGSVSPGHGESQNSDQESIDSNGFPSLRSLSQTAKSNGRRSVEKHTEISPEPTRRSLRIRKADAGFSDPLERDSPPAVVKASQNHEPRMSQIPQHTTIVDLTQSSPTGSPAKSSTSGGINTNGRRAVSSQQATAFKKSFEGLGEKSFLKRKKKSS